VSGRAARRLLSAVPSRSSATRRATGNTLSCLTAGTGRADTTRVLHHGSSLLVDLPPISLDQKGVGRHGGEVPVPRASPRAGITGPNSAGNRPGRLLARGGAAV
jgi:hypothetical protein